MCHIYNTCRHVSRGQSNGFRTIGGCCWLWLLHIHICMHLSVYWLLLTSAKIIDDNKLNLYHAVPSALSLSFHSFSSRHSIIIVIEMGFLRQISTAKRGGSSTEKYKYKYIFIPKTKLWEEIFRQTQKHIYMHIYTCKNTLLSLPFYWLARTFRAAPWRVICDSGCCAEMRERTVSGHTHTHKHTHMHTTMRQAKVITHQQPMWRWQPVWISIWCRIKSIRLNEW